MIDYIIAHPLYIPFLIFNIFVIYRMIKFVLNRDQDQNDDDDQGGIIKIDNPKVDLPPGVTPPVIDKEPVLAD